MTERIYVTARFNSRADKVKEMISLLATLASATRGENGCLEYSYYQSVADSTTFTSFEVWENSESEAEHWETQHLKDALIQLPDLMAGEAEITKYTKVV